MTDEEILQKAIEKALKNGFDIQKNWGYGPYFWQNMNEEGKFNFCKKLLSRHLEGYKSVIFSHSFTRAFFKDLEWEWTHYLQEMVLEKKTLSYLATFL